MRRLTPTTTTDQRAPAAHGHHALLQSLVSFTHAGMSPAEIPPKPSENL